MLSSTRKDDHAGVYSGSQGIINLLLFFFSFFSTLSTLHTISLTLFTSTIIEVKDLTVVINTISYYQMSHIIITVSDL